MSITSPIYDPLQPDMFDDNMSITFGPLTGTGSITLSNPIGNITSPWPTTPSITTTITNGTGGVNMPWITTSNLTATVPLVDTYSKPGALEVHGDANFNGNLTVGGVNLVEVLTNIEKRLNILRVNKDLEDRWEELRELGEKYRALEQEIITREDVWKALQS